MLARAQKVWQEDDAYSTSRPLSRLCPALRPLGAYPRFAVGDVVQIYKLPRGAAFGANAPASHAPLAWLPCAVLDQGCRNGLAFGTTFDPCEPRPVEGPYPVLVCVEIKFRTPHGLWPNSLVDFHTGSRAVREIRPGHVSFLNFDKYHLNEKTSTAITTKPGAERRPSLAEATVR